MANSQYEYVKSFERDEILLPNMWIVVRIDGRGFHKLSDHYIFTKPNDTRALALMNAAASALVSALPDICIAYGVSDEYSFVFHKSTTLFERRAAKLVSTVVSTLTAFYVYLWSRFMDGVELEMGFLPTFDGRAVCYPSMGNLRDYLRWRQVDCHINNLYNTTFWAMVQKGGYSARDAEKELNGSVSVGKRNEILWARYGVNYNNEPEMFRKGSVVFREYGLEDNTKANGVQQGVKAEPALEPTTEVAEGTAVPSKTQAEKLRKAKAKAKVVVEHVDIMNDAFWEKRPWILSGKPPLREQA